MGWKGIFSSVLNGAGQSTGVAGSLATSLPFPVPQGGRCCCHGDFGDSWSDFQMFAAGSQLALEARGFPELTLPPTPAGGAAPSPGPTRHGGAPRAGGWDILQTAFTSMCLLCAQARQALRVMLERDKDSLAQACWGAVPSGDVAGGLPETAGSGPSSPWLALGSQHCLCIVGWACLLGIPYCVSLGMLPCRSEAPVVGEGIATASSEGSRPP